MWQEFLDLLRKLVRTANAWQQKRGAERFVVHCKECKRAVPIGSRDCPFHSIPVRCCLCGAIETYRPSQVVFALPHELVRLQKGARGLRFQPSGRPVALGLFR